MMYATTNLSNITLLGAIVSMWKKSNRRHKITLKLCHMIEECFQCEFGDCLSVSCAGVNCYFGNHHSSRLKKRPETKNGERKNDYYARQRNKCKENAPLCEKFVALKKRLTLQSTYIGTQNRITTQVITNWS